MRISWAVILILLASIASANSLFVETELSPILRGVYAIHAGIEILPNRIDAFGTYMGGGGSRSSSTFLRPSSGEFKHRCFGLGIRVSRDHRVSGRFQSFNLRIAQTDWSTANYDPVQDNHIAIVWSQGRRYYKVGTHYFSWSFDLGIQRIHRIHSEREEMRIAGIIGLTFSLGFYAF
jgi:hypothetical protein